MDPSIRARRLAEARNRLRQSAAALAERHGLQNEATALDAASRARPQVRDLFELEAVAGLLESLAAVETEPNVVHEESKPKRSAQKSRAKSEAE